MRTAIACIVLVGFMFAALYYYDVGARVLCDPKTHEAYTVSPYFKGARRMTPLDAVCNT